MVKNKPSDKLTIEKFKLWKIREESDQMLFKGNLMSLILHFSWKKRQKVH